MPDKQKRLGRLLRVRELQLGQVRARESDAASRLFQEHALRDRIAQLAAGVAPITASAPASAMSIIAAAHYRERLQQTAEAAARRVDGAERALDHARAATVEAKRDQSAMEKLIERAGQEAAAKARRALESLPPAPPVKRHDSC